MIKSMVICSNFHKGTSIDCEILYHMGKVNVVADPISRKTTSPVVGSLCMRISIDSTLLDMIREAHAEGVKKENWKQERIIREIDKFTTDNLGLLTRYGRVQVPYFGGVRKTFGQL